MQKKLPVRSKNTACFAFFLCFFLVAASVFGQKTMVHGKLLDADSRDPLPYASVQFEGEPNGTRTDLNGNFLLETHSKKVRIVRASYIGYISQTAEIKLGERNELVFRLVSSTSNLTEITVRPEKYRRKNNPAVDLIAQVFAHKDENRMAGLDFYEYRAYEKLEFDLNHITDKFRRKWFFKRFQYIFNYVDTNRVSGHVALPLYFRERLSRQVFRKSPRAQKDYIEAENQTTVVSFGDNDNESNGQANDESDGQSMSDLLDALYSEVDIYEGKISLLATQFTGPLSAFAPSLYRFYLTDTVDFQGVRCANVFFAPTFKGDLAFMGNLLVALDSSYAVRRVEMGISKEINLNFVKDLHLEQEFSFVGEGQNRHLMKTKDDVTMEFAVFKNADGRTLLGRKSVVFSDQKAGEALPDSLFRHVENTLKLDSTRLRKADFWVKNRPVALPDREQGIYALMDSLQNDRTLKRLDKLGKLLFSSYQSVGPFEFGPINATYSFNDIEGTRLRIGGRTTPKFSKKWLFETYAAYGFRDQTWKYYGAATYAFGKARPRRFPMNQWTISHSNDVQLAGQDFQFYRNDNLFQSFQRGSNADGFYNQVWRSNYQREFRSGFSFSILAERSEKRSAGSLFFDYTQPSTGEILKKSRVVNTSFGFQLRFAANETRIEGARSRTVIENKFPVFTLNFRQSVRGLLGGEFPYAVASFGVQKLFFLAPFGKSVASMKIGRVFGSGVAYPLLDLPRSNQTFFYKRTAFNLMNNLEFVSDKYIGLNIAHDFNGFFFNKIPIVKKLKWREIVHFNGLLGDLDAANTPSTTNGLLRFPTDASGRTLTHALGSKPYLEAAVGVGNIFGFLQIMYVRRLTYLDLPGVARAGWRLSAGLSF